MITRYSLEMRGMAFVHRSPRESDEERDRGRDGGVKIKRRREEVWRMRKRGNTVKKKNDRGDKMRQIERGTMRAGIKKECLGQ
ncbi:hypothetical protein NQZ68_023090 [Dissostichus eleginoides]|nr:hypothetical protein NQZ68_023090 [Dissostichus eleginoides]